MEGMSLYDLDRSIAAVLNDSVVFCAETGEVIFDESMLDELEVGRTEKLEACGLYAKSLDSEARAIRDEERRLAERRRAKEAKAERMKEYIRSSMEFFGDSKVETPRLCMGLRKSSRVVITDPDLIPGDLFGDPKPPEPDKAAIKNAIKSGREVPGAMIDESKTLNMK